MPKITPDPVEIPKALADDQRLATLIAIFKKRPRVDPEKDPVLSNIEKRILKKKLQQAEYTQLFWDIVRFLRSYTEHSLVASYGLPLVTQAMERSIRSAAAKKGVQTRERNKVRILKRKKDEEEKARQGAFLL